ncbi:MAG: AbrB/MazE/SpoVT family DNA-binding domain-containing protein [Anaerolineales bacterium]|nr:AbrB/MazE/SpoVT family DNA-binding domain-containing protein [Anaerolineales bacterium]
MSVYVRVQEKGQVTIPTRLRRKFNLKKGDTVMFVETKDGVLIKPAEVIVSEALANIGEALRAEGITLEDWIEKSREFRAKMLREEYGFKEEDLKEER